MRVMGIMGWEWALNADNEISWGLGDINRDGAIDIIVGNLDKTRVWIGTGDGTFDFQRDPFTTEDEAFPKEPIAFLIHDLDRDDNPDLLVLDAQESVSVWKGKGNGSFAFGYRYNNILGTDMALGEMTGDGVVDLVIADGYSRTVSVLTGKGDGRFSPKIDYAAGGGDRLVLGDLNNDGWTDVVTTNSEQDAFSVLLSACHSK